MYVYVYVCRYCSAVPDTHYNRDTALISATFKESEFLQDPACSGALENNFIGYEPEYGGDSFHIDLDVQSLVIAMAVNLGFLSLETLDYAENFNLEIAVPIPGSKRNVTYLLNGYYDLRYTSMTPILCMQNVTIAPPPFLTVLCVLVFQGSSEEFIGLPIFHHGGVNTGTGFYPCNCSLTSQYSSSLCNEFNLMSGFIVYNRGATSLLKEDLVRVYTLAITAHSGYKNFNDAMSPALFLAEGIITGVVTTPDVGMVRKALSPCTVNYTSPTNPHLVSGTFNCSLVIFQSLDHITHHITENHYQLHQGSCRDTFTIPADKWFRTFIHMTA